MCRFKGVPSGIHLEWQSVLGAADIPVSADYVHEREGNPGLVYGMFSRHFDTVQPICAMGDASGSAGFAAVQ